MGIFTKYLEKGYSPLPIGYMTKYPCILVDKQWKNYTRLGKLSQNPINKEDTALWDTWTPFGVGVGIAVGEHSGVIALDFDSDDEFTDEIKNLLPIPPVTKKGQKGLTAFFKYNGEKNKKWRAEGKKDYTLELLSTGNQTVIPPSFHPTTMQPYEWGANGNTLLNVEKDDLPSLPENFYNMVDEIIGIKKNEAFLPVQSIEQQETTPDDIKSALEYIDPDCPYEDWITIGMALRDGLGDSGLLVWDQWSRKSSKYPKKGDPSTHTKWKSFTHTGITVASLFQKAILNGYVKEYDTETVYHKIPFIEKLKLEASPVGAKDRLDDGFPLHLCRNAPNLVGDIQKWVEESAMYPQPILALGAAVSVVGVLYAHKFEGSTRSRTNMFCLGVAPSSSGKEYPRKCVEVLLAECNKIALLGGDPASSAGLLKSLKDGNGKRIVQIDEFGRVLKGMNNKNASGHVAGLPTVMMKLFSSANSTYFGTEYANHDGKMDRKDIKQPCLCIHASTVPEHLYQAMTGTDAIDGFLSRWLIFEEKGFPDANEHSTSSTEVPVEILEKIIKVDENTATDGNMAEFVIAPRLVPFDKEAKVLADDFCKSMRRRAQEKQAIGDITYAIWGRTYEHSTKLAIVGSDGVSVTKEVMKWALEVATYCSQYICDQVHERIADNQYEKDLKAVVEIIKRGGVNGVKKSDVTKKTQHLNLRERNDILSSLLESERIEAKQETTKTKNLTKYYFIS